GVRTWLDLADARRDRSHARVALLLPRRRARDVLPPLGGATAHAGGRLATARGDAADRRRARADRHRRLVLRRAAADRPRARRHRLPLLATHLDVSLHVPGPETGEVRAVAERL